MSTEYFPRKLPTIYTVSANYLSSHHSFKKSPKQKSEKIMDVFRMEVYATTMNEI